MLLLDEPVSLFVVLDPTFEVADPNRCNNVLRFPVEIDCGDSKLTPPPPSTYVKVTSACGILRLSSPS